MERSKTGYLTYTLSRVGLDQEVKSIQTIKNEVISDKKFDESIKSKDKYCEVCKTEFDRSYEKLHMFSTKHEKAWKLSNEKCSAAFEKIESDLNKKFDFSEANDWKFEFGNNMLDINFQQQLLDDQQEFLSKFKEDATPVSTKKTTVASESSQESQVTPKISQNLTVTPKSRILTKVHTLQKVQNSDEASHEAQELKGFQSKQEIKMCENNIKIQFKDFLLDVEEPKNCFILPKKEQILTQNIPDSTSVRKLRKRKKENLIS